MWKVQVHQTRHMASQNSGIRIRCPFFDRFLVGEKITRIIQDLEGSPRFFTLHQTPSKYSSSTIYPDTERNWERERESVSRAICTFLPESRTVLWFHFLYCCRGGFFLLFFFFFFFVFLHICFRRKPTTGKL